MGFRLAALMEGRRPNRIPMSMENTTETTITGMLMAVGVSVMLDMTFARIFPTIDTDDASHTGEHGRLGEELGQNPLFLGSDSLLKTNLAGSLGDGHEHDVHNADATDQKRNTGDPDELLVSSGVHLLLFLDLLDHLICLVFDI